MSEMYDRKEFFATYLANASEKPLFVKKFSEKFISTGDRTSILDLGSHDGTLILNVLAQIKAKLPKVTKIAAVDPSEAAISIFREKLLPAGITAEFHAKTAEDFLQNSQQNFDWVIASHCLYWSQDLLGILKSIQSHGKSCVVVCRGEKGIYEIQTRFKSLLGNKAEQLYSANNIEACLKKLGSKFVREEHQTKIIIPDLDSQQFKWLASFFLQTTEDLIPAEGWEEIKNFLKPYENQMRHDVNFFWITNSKTP